MAEPVLLKDLKVYFGGYDFTSNLDSAEIGAAKAELADNRFGDSAETFFPGLEQVSVDLGGFTDFTDNGQDEQMWARVDDTATPATWPLALCPPWAPAAAAGAVGNVAYVVAGNQYAYNVGGEHGQLMKFNVRSLPDSQFKLYRHRIEVPKTSSVSAPATSTGYQYGAITATQEFVASVYVFSFGTATGSWTLTLQSDDNSGFASPTSRGTFKAITSGPTAETIRVAGAVTDDYWRVVLTETATGSVIAYAVTMGVANL